MYNLLSVPKFVFSNGEMKFLQNIEFANTLLGQLVRDGESLAIISFEHNDEQPELIYAQMKEILDMKAISLGGKSFFKLGATGSLKRDGSVFVTDSIRLLGKVHQYLASSKKPLQQQCIAYFSNLITPCLRGMRVLDVKVLFVEDKIDGNYDTTNVPYGVGDCSGKISLGLHDLLSQNASDAGTDGEPIFMCQPSRAIQFRCMGIDEHFISKGTLAPCDTGGYDLILPLSSVKGGIVSEGEYTGRILLGSYLISEPDVTRFGDQFLRVFPTEVIRKAGLYEEVEKVVVKMSAMQQDLTLAVKFLQNSMELSGRDDNEQYIFDHILRNMDVEKDAWLVNHPFIGVSVMETLGKRITRNVLGGTLTGERFLLLPDDSLKFGTLESVHLGHSTCIPGKSPIVNHMEMRILNTEYRADGLIGCAYCSHETASSMTSDFDGDQISILPYRPSLHALFSHIRSMPTLKLVNKAKNPSTKSFSELAVLVFQSTLELYASLITAVYCQVTHEGWCSHYEELILELSDKLQTAVDSQKHDPGYDVYATGKKDLKKYGHLFQAFQKAKKQTGIGKAPYVYVPLATSKETREGEIDDVGSIAELIRHANEFWLPSQFEANLRPLISFQDLFGVPSRNVTGTVSKFRADFKGMRDLKDENFTELKFARQWASEHMHDDYFVELWRSLHFHKDVVCTYEGGAYIPTARLVFEAYGKRCIQQATKDFVIYGASKEPAAKPIRDILAAKGVATVPVEVSPYDDHYNDLLVVGRQSLKLGVVSLMLPPGRYTAILRFRKTNKGVSPNTLLLEVIR